MSLYVIWNVRGYAEANCPDAKKAWNMSAARRAMIAAEFEKCLDVCQGLLLTFSNCFPKFFI